MRPRRLALAFGTATLVAVGCGSPPTDEPRGAAPDPTTPHPAASDQAEPGPAEADPTEPVDGDEETWVCGGIRVGAASLDGDAPTADGLTAEQRTLFDAVADQGVPTDASRSSS